MARAARDEFRLWCALVGDSAGGNLALGVSLGLAETVPFDAQLLFFPCLDASMREPSYARRASGFGLTREQMRSFWAAYAGPSSSEDPLLSPARASDLSRLPSTILVSAGFDVLYDENSAFGRRLHGAGVPLTELPSPSLPHGFIETIEFVPAARAATVDALSHLARHRREAMPS